MVKKNKNIKLLIIFLITLLTGFACSGTVSASIKSEAIFWPALEISGPLFGSEKLLYRLYTENLTNLSQHQNIESKLESALGYKITPHFVVWAGYAYVIAQRPFTPNEKQFYQDAVWDLFDKDQIRLTSRTRLEEIEEMGEDQYLYRLRQRLLLIFPKGFGSHFSPIFYDEVFYHLNQPGWVPQRGLAQNRAFMGIRVLLTKSINVDIGYMNQYLWDPKIDFDNHNVAITLNIDT